MNEMIQEWASAGGRIDGNLVRGVKILGLESRNGRRYRPAAAREAVGLYEGCRVNVNHPKGSPSGPRDYQDRFGSFQGVVYREGQGLFGEFRFNPMHPVAEQFKWDVENAPNNAGFSHNVEARTSTEAGKKVIEAIVRVQSVDLVADPATTSGIFEQTDGSVLARPDLSPEIVAAYKAPQFRAALDRANNLSFVESLRWGNDEVFLTFNELRAKLNIGNGDLEKLLKDGNVQPAVKHADIPIYSLNAVRAALEKLTGSQGDDDQTESFAPLTDPKAFVEMLTGRRPIRRYN